MFRKLAKASYISFMVSFAISVEYHTLLPESW